MVVYPIVVNKEKNDFLVYIPDFDAHTEGKDLADALYMARDCIGSMMLAYDDLGKKHPIPSDISMIDSSEGIPLVVDIDYTSYKAKYDNTPVKKNCSIPRYMYDEVERRHINCSKLLQEAIKNVLAQ